ncbi:MAG: PD40 domain-containing protein, partial [Bdellovibrionales bacterium]|nr:PD40 domain-containing protein [Bdellovibrionales bacterium]
DTAAGYDRRQPRYSSDGTQITYSSNRPLTAGGSRTSSMNIWVSSSSSLTETAITSTTTSGQDAYAPEFNVSDQYIAFEGYLPVSGVTPQSSNIWVYDIVGSSTTPITKNTGANLDSKLMPGSTW